MTEMDKLAQRRRLRDIGYGAVNLKKHIHEGLSPMFKKHMKELTKIDDALREEVNESDPKQYIKSAKSFYNSRRYLDALASIKEFLDKVYPLIEKTEPLKKIFDEEKFYADPSGVDSHEKLRDLSKRRRERRASHNIKFIKESGITDYPRHIYDAYKALTGDERERDSYVMERRRKLEVKKKKEAIHSLIVQAKDIFKKMKDTFDKFGAARAKGDVEAYVRAAKEFDEKFDAFENEVVDKYQGLFAEEYKQAQEAAEKEEAAKEKVEKEKREKKEREKEEREKEESAEAPDEAELNGEISVSLPPAEPGQQAVPEYQSSYLGRPPEETDPQSVSRAPEWNRPPEEAGIFDVPKYSDPLYTVNYKELSDIIKSAQNCLLLGDTGLAAALLAKGSQICEELGAEKQSLQLYAMAKELINE